MKYLFIGGTADGQRLEVPDGSMEWSVPNYSRMRVGEYDDQPEEKLRLKDRYCGWNYYGHRVFVLEGATDILPLLLENYRPGDIVNGFLRPDTSTEEETKKRRDYIMRGGRPDQAICICPNIPKP